MTLDLTRTHFKQLDGLRGLAVLLVMVYHYGLLHSQGHAADPGLALQAARFGWMGVDLFFVLSGFLITTILLQTRATEHYFRNFLMRRFLRIWPLYYANLILFFLIAPLLLPSVPAELDSMIAKQEWFWLYGANWLYAREGGFNQTSGGYFWSLAVEEQFYLLWPFVVYFLEKRTLFRVAATLLGVSLAARLILFAFDVNTNALYTMTFTHVDGLAVGALISVSFQTDGMPQRLRRFAPWVSAVAIAALAIIVASDGDAFFWNPAMATFGYTVVALLFGAGLIAALSAPVSSIVMRTLCSKPLTAAGKYSYALYMVHVPIAAFGTDKLLELFARLAPSSSYTTHFLAVIAVNFALSFAVAMLSWRLFEGPILKLKKYFEYEHAAHGRAAATIALDASKSSQKAL